MTTPTHTPRADEPRTLAARVGNRIREERVRQGGSLRGLADAAALDHAQISKLERGYGNPTLGVLERIADALGVEAADFFREPAALASPQGEPRTLSRREDEIGSLLLEFREAQPCPDRGEYVDRIRALEAGEPRTLERSEPEPRGAMIVYRIENPVAGDYIARDLRDAAEFIAGECSGMDVGERITVHVEEMDEAAVRALPEWEA